MQNYRFKRYPNNKKAPIMDGIKKLTPHIKEDRDMISILSLYMGARIIKSNCPRMTNSVKLMVGKMLKNKNRMETDKIKGKTSISIFNM